MVGYLQRKGAETTSFKNLISNILSDTEEKKQAAHQKLVAHAQY